MSVTAGSRVLVIGYGNPGRGDDGLGPALAEAVAALHLPGVTVESDYQLTVDHAAMIAAHDRVIFADAMIGLAEPCRLTPVSAETPGGMGSHQISPEAALHLAGLLFGHAPPGWILAIAGADFGEVSEGLSPVARENLGQAVAVLQDWLT
jgi:hydrogenase maturation protease